MLLLNKALMPFVSSTIHTIAGQFLLCTPLPPVVLSIVSCRCMPLQSYHLIWMMVSNQTSNAWMFGGLISLNSDAIAQFERPSFDVSKLIRVHFIGKPAVDTGDPRREFFRLFLQDLKSKSTLFQHTSKGLIPLHNGSLFWCIQNDRRNPGCLCSPWWSTSAVFCTNNWQLHPWHISGWWSASMLRLWP